MKEESSQAHLGFERFRSMIENSDVGYFFIDKDGIVRDVNPAWVKLYRYESSSEIIGRHFTIIQKLEDLDLAREFVEHIMHDDPGFVKGEFSRLCKDGTTGYHSFSAMPVVQNGEVIGIEGFIVDTTRRTIAENALVENEARFRSLFDNMAEGMSLHQLVYDETGNAVDYRIIDVNPAFEKILGIKAENARDTLATVLYGVNNAPFLEVYCKVAQTGERHIFETYFPPMERYFEISAFSPKKDFFATVFLDVTDRKRALEDLTKSEEKYREIFENVEDIFYQSDLEGNIREISPSVERHAGYTREELMGKNATIFYQEQKDREQFLNELKKNGRVNDFEMILRSKSGEFIHTSASSRLVFDQSGKAVGIDGALRNISRRKKAELEMIIAKERAEESERLKTAFLANMSHEIRTPMNSILGFTELLDDESLSPEDRKQFISIISSNSRQLLTVINDIIDISKIESNLLTISRTTFNLNHLLDNLLVSFQHEKTRLGKHQIELLSEKSLGDEHCYVLTDDVRLRQILNNLIGNALKFTTSGHVKFGYMLEENHFLFFVEDTGKGISKTKQEIVFHRFRQEEESYTRQFGGTGLGLSISKGLVELLGGTIWFNSPEGKGTTFYFTLPGSIISTQKLPDPDQKNIIPVIDFSGKTFLVAEDVRENFNYIDIILRRTGAAVLYAENGEQAVNICRSRLDINVILMDIQMPVKNGFEATREIRVFNKTIRIIGLTAYSYAEDKIRCLEAGCNDFISKPIERDKLLSVLRKNI